MQHDEIEPKLQVLVNKNHSKREYYPIDLKLFLQFKFPWIHQRLPNSDFPRQNCKPWFTIEESYYKV